MVTCIQEIWNPGFNRVPVRNTYFDQYLDLNCLNLIQWTER